MHKEIQWASGEEEERKKIIQIENIGGFAVSLKKYRYLVLV